MTSTELGKRKDYTSRIEDYLTSESSYRKKQDNIEKLAKIIINNILTSDKVLSSLPEANTLLTGKASKKFNF